MSVPTYSLNRCNEITRHFFESFGRDADFVSRSPGRVNIIGEHIDYCNFSVLPMAIDVEMLLAVHVVRGSTSIELKNADPKFAPRCFDIPLEASIGIDPALSDWSNYFKCGLLVAQTLCQETGQPMKDIGMQVFCQGTVPTGGGLSSSAAFICATALATIRAVKGPKYVISKQDLTRITADAEHYLGVNNGGMDQCASVCGEKDHALYVEFKPALKATPFPLPSSVRFIIANTLVVSNKFETAPTNYNLRVVECTIAASVLAHTHGVSLLGEKTPGNLRQVIYTLCERAKDTEGTAIQKDALDKIDEEINKLQYALNLVEETLGSRSKGYTMLEASTALEMTPEEFTREYLTSFPVRFHLLQLYLRARHVYSEALRVLQCLRLMTNVYSTSTDTQKFLRNFGTLMNTSQTSCRDNYECSCEETEQMCSIALNNGSLGSRLTGAGWGGCIISLCPDKESVARVKRALIDEYYNEKFPKISSSELDAAIIVSKPVAGSALYEYL
ncbi:galactokinase [Zygosaccharomyces mellis]|uniref:Galactokinase n=1 Tax=Zygosaccharomyces mellis TaxID=42258 RepID=A0A4C2E655_9SACH|nr:galactokinase [Zygosaccharomyces mellis]